MENVKNTYLLQKSEICRNLKSWPSMTLGSSLALCRTVTLQVAGKCSGLPLESMKREIELSHPSHGLLVHASTPRLFCCRLGCCNVLTLSANTVHRVASDFKLDFLCEDHIF